MHEAVWKRFEALRPCLSEHFIIVPQTFRGERWYLVQDQSSGSNLRINALTYQIIARLTGAHTVRNVIARMRVRFPEQVPEPDEIVHLLRQLDDMSALKDPLPADLRQLMGMAPARSRKHSGRRLSNPLALRFPLLDPDRLLTRIAPSMGWLFTRRVFALWLAIVLTAALLALIELPAIASDASARLLSPRNLLLVWLTYPLIKIVHEFAHGLALKTWGGEVHEMGISLLVLMPVPYVDASGSWMLRNKYKRMLVSAAGIMTELLLAALALFVWLVVEPGLVRELALNTMLVGGLSALLINGNPLLRFDGYHILQDWLEIPNLSSRASRYCLYLIQRYPLRITDANSPVTGQGERPWLACYGVAATLYRILIMTTIALFLASEYLIAGVALATWAMVMMLIVPLFRATAFLSTSPLLLGKRGRAIATSAAAIGALLVLLAGVPVTHTTNAQGVVWLPAQAQIYARAEGFVEQVIVPDGGTVVAGAPIVQLHAPELIHQGALLSARKEELQAARAAEQFVDPVRAEAIAREIDALEAEIKQNAQQQGHTAVRSGSDGTFVQALQTNLSGRHVEQGDLVGYVINPGSLVVRCVIPQRDIGRIRSGTSDVQIRLAEDLASVVQARIVRESPAADHQLPSPALAAAGGGKVVTQADQRGNQRTLDALFHVDLALPDEFRVSGIGGRAYVRFEHPPQPLFVQWALRLRQLLLSRLAV